MREGSPRHWVAGACDRHGLCLGVCVPATQPPCAQGALEGSSSRSRGSLVSRWQRQQSQPAPRGLLRPRPGACQSPHRAPPKPRPERCSTNDARFVVGRVWGVVAGGWVGLEAEAVVCWALGAAVASKEAEGGWVEAAASAAAQVAGAAALVAREAAVAAAKASTRTCGVPVCSGLSSSHTRICGTRWPRKPCRRWRR